METIQYNLPQSRIPLAWYNIVPDLPAPMAPPLHPGTLQPLGPDDLAPLFPMALIMQEVSAEREIEIPGEVRQIYAQWRPAPLMRARRLEKALASTTSTKASRPPARTSSTPPSRRPGTTSRRASPISRPKPAPDSGARRWRWLARFSVSTARSSWCASATTRSPIAAL